MVGRSLLSGKRLSVDEICSEMPKGLEIVTLVLADRGQGQRLFNVISECSAVVMQALRQIVVKKEPSQAKSTVVMERMKSRLQEAKTLGWVSGFRQRPDIWRE